MSGTDGVASYGYAFAVSGTIAMTITFVYLAAERKPLSLADRAMFVALTGALTGLALAETFAHHYARALLLAFVIALFGAAARAVCARAPQPARHESAPREADGRFAARPRGWARVRCACPECLAKRRRGPRPYQ